jgi:hypothetical protein
MSQAENSEDDTYCVGISIQNRAVDGTIGDSDDPRCETHAVDVNNCQVKKKINLILAKMLSCLKRHKYVADWLTVGVALLAVWYAAGAYYAAQGQNEILIKNAVETFRGNIYIYNARMTDLGIGWTPRIELMVVNVGMRPVTQIDHYSEFKITDKETTKTDIDNAPLMESSNPGFIAPNDTMYIWGIASKSVDSSGVFLINSTSRNRGSKSKAVFFGHIDYYDNYGQKHYFPYYFSYAGDGSDANLRPEGPFYKQFRSY